jgi:hypothetical protein
MGLADSAAVSEKAKLYRTRDFLFRAPGISIALLTGFSDEIRFGQDAIRIKQKHVHFC